MSVYIRGIEMPTIEMEWTIRYGADGKWYAIDTNAETTDGEWHEIISIPEHGRLIDADALSKNIIGAIYHSELRTAPTIIQASEEGK